MPTIDATRSPIRVLPTLVANQIAAGEVVERPASVVKELIENALDAGSTRITLDLEQGGIELIRVSDDGSGIPEEELPLALAPHATSKISATADLDHIATLGFRGEALASIAAVSRLSIRSRTAQQPAASLIEVEGDSRAAPKPAAGPVGTSVTIRNLFFNTPARRKFLRTVATEQDRCLDAFRHIALAHPAVGFTATADGRTVIDLPPAQSPRDRVLGVLGKELANQLIDANADEFDDSRGVALWGLAGLPSIARGTNKHQYIFINGRPIRDRTIQHAIAEAYRGLIEPGRFPTIVLMLEMSAAGVDVNVHPQKAEVRFRDSSLIHSVVLRAVRDSLRRADLTPAYSALKAGWQGAQLTPGSLEVSSDLPGTGVPIQIPAAAPDDPGALNRFVEYFKSPQAAGAGSPGFQYSAMKQAIEQASPPDPALLDTKPASRVLQVHNSYLVTQDDQGVVIIDQHALHERVMFEYLLRRVMSGGLESQNLLAPAVVEATPTQLELLPALDPLLTRIGVAAVQTGPATIGVNAFPSFLFDRGVDPIEFTRELFERAETTPMIADIKRGGEQAMRDVLDMMSCKAAVKAGDHMSPVELDELVKLRQEVERSSNCPHGRPTSIRLTIKELEKLFGRA
ncbi:MAG: DNA mismatch repair endonuclease MutL [Planctomycetes bacterium]|nr:DNA mismatch repair endonuclease MutL [Planctomycetota bacterium]